MNPADHRATLAPDPASETGAVPVLAVCASDEVYGFPLSSVREILVTPPVAEVPRTSKAVLGVISVRGQIITLIDLSKLLNLRARYRGAHTRVLLVDSGDELLGVAVDSVIQVYRMEPDQIEYASMIDAELCDYVVGVGRISTPGDDAEETMLILIDPVSLLGA